MTNETTPQLSSDILAAIHEWRSADPDEDTQHEVDVLLSGERHEQLREQFSSPLEFGTAGLRGLLGAGPNRMNRAVVRRATFAFCEHMKATLPYAAERGLCIGYDGRMKSRLFAEDAARVAVACGLRVWLFAEESPTPLVAYAMRELRCGGAVVITASHNPPLYNGYKVYWANGAQIIPPHDELIARRMSAISSTADVRLNDVDFAKEDNGVELVGDDLRARYYDFAARLMLHRECPRVSVAYTAMHGVGTKAIRAVFSRIGVTALHEVEEQALPDGSFPTVAFPNPEEKGAMDLVLAKATAHEVDIVIANDPDADRLAAAVRHNGHYRVLNGNELGTLFAHYMLEQGSQHSNRLVAESIVSSPLLLRIARAHNAQAEQTLTGHKWIQNRALALVAEQGMDLVFSYEEALGYAVSAEVRDKDGITAAAMFVDMASWAKSQGRTLIDELHRAYGLYGMAMSDQVSLVFPASTAASQISALMKRAETASFEDLAKLGVHRVSDFATGVQRTRSSTASFAVPAKTTMIVFDIDGDHRIMLRPSGTEPKMKIYFDVSIDCTDGSIADGTARGRVLLDELIRSMGVLLGTELRS